MPAVADSPPFTYEALEQSGGTWIGHLDASCRDIKGDRRLDDWTDRDAWPCSRCVSLEQLDAWDPDFSTRKKIQNFSAGTKDFVGVVRYTGCTAATDTPEDTTMAKSTSTYGKAKNTAPIHTVKQATNGLCSTHRTALLSDGDCWECGSAPTAPDFASLKAAFAAAIADGIQGAQSLREALLAAYRADPARITPAVVIAALETLATMRTAQADLNPCNDDMPVTPPPAPKPATTGPAFEAGMIVTNAAGRIVRLYLSKSSGKLYGKVRVDGYWEYTQGAMRGARHLTAEEAKAYGVVQERCVFCATPIETKESLAAGYGPDCAERYNLPWGNKA